jgi:hypothetical protein
MPVIKKPLITKNISSRNFLSREHLQLYNNNKTNVEREYKESNSSDGINSRVKFFLHGGWQVN